MIYNFVIVTAGIDLDSSIITKLATHPNVVGVKLSYGNCTVSLLLKPCEFAVCSGRSDVFTQGLISGRAGGIIALADIAPKTHIKLF